MSNQSHPPDKELKALVTKFERLWKKASRRKSLRRRENLLRRAKAVEAAVGQRVRNGSPSESE